MDPRERHEDGQEATKVAIERKLGRVWTSMPVIVHADSEGHTVNLQPAIKGWNQADDGTMTAVQMTTLGKAVVNYTSGGGFTITHPIKEKDEGIAMFAARCLDGWFKDGGVQAEPYRRRHHLSDSMYIPGIRSTPRKLGGSGPNADGSPLTPFQEGLNMMEGRTSKPPSTNSVQIRSDDGQYFIELGPDGAVNIICKNCTVTATEKVTIHCKELDIKASDKVEIDSPKVHLTGDLDVDGEVTGKNVRLSTHRHTQVQGGQGTSGPPEAG